MVTFPLKYGSIRGITLFELLIATLMVTMVFVASASVYVSALRFLTNMTATSQASLPINIDSLAKRITQANDVGLVNGILRLRGDFPASTGGWNGPSLNTPSVFGDDSFASYAFCLPANNCTGLCESFTAAPCTDANANILVANTLNTSGFQLISPSGPTSPSGQSLAATVVQINVDMAGPPPVSLRTSVIVGAKNKG